MKLKDAYSSEGGYDQPRQHIKKQRYYFVNKDPSSFSSGHVWMWELDSEESWTPKNWCFWTVVWRRLLRVPWTARRSNLSILKEISPGCSLVGLMLKLKIQYCGHLMWRADSFEKTLILGKIEGRRRRGPQRMRWLDGIADSMDMGLGGFGSCWWTGRPGVLQFLGSQRVGHDWVTELNWLQRWYLMSQGKCFLLVWILKSDRNESSSGRWKHKHEELRRIMP